MSKFYDALNEFSYAASQRGRKYYVEGRIHSFNFDNYECHAKVNGSGSNVYNVHIKFNKRYDIVNNSCSCPVGYYCKHVASVLYMLDDMASNNALEVENEHIEEKGSFKYKMDLEAIFVKYFITKYHYSPSFTPLNAYIKKYQEEINAIHLEFYSYLASKLFEYCFSYYYDIKETIRFLSLHIISIFTKEDYFKFLDALFSNSPRRIIPILGAFIQSDYHNDDYSINELSNDYLYSLLVTKDSSILLSGGDELLSPRYLSIKNLSVLVPNYIRLINQYQTRDHYAEIKNKGIENLEEARRIYYYLVILFDKRLYVKDEIYLIEQIKDYDLSIYHDLLFHFYIYNRSASSFIHLLKSYSDNILEEEMVKKLKRMKNKPFYISLYLKEPFILDDASILEVAEFLEVEHIYDGYQYYLRDYSIRKINRNKKLKSYDSEIIAAFKILDYFHYEEIANLLLDKDVKEKLKDNNTYLYFLYKYNLLESLGYKHYGTIS